MKKYFIPRTFHTPGFLLQKFRPWNESEIKNERKKLFFSRRGCVKSELIFSREKIGESASQHIWYGTHKYTNTIVVRHQNNTTDHIRNSQVSSVHNNFKKLCEFKFSCCALKIILPYYQQVPISDSRWYSLNCKFRLRPYNHFICIHFH
jgi:hypothetical protein